MGERKNTGACKTTPIYPVIIAVIITIVVSGSSVIYVTISNQNNCIKQENQTNHVDGHWFWNHCGEIDFR